MHPAPCIFQTPMKTIMLLRHGKSDWNVDYGSDHDRPLAQRGQKAAGLMGEFLTKIHAAPEKVLTSTAKRARETLDLAMLNGRWECPVCETRDLYFASPEQILEIIQQQSDSVEHLLLVGHNPTWEYLISLLVGGGLFRMPTAALAKIRIQTEHWSDVSGECGILEFLVTPKLLMKAGIG